MIAALALLAVQNLPRPDLSPLPPRPRLTVVVSIDQFRSDYVARFAPYYLPAKLGAKVGGFNWLATAGANYIDSHYEHVPTFTGPGHSVILTGSTLALDGIVGNEWFDRATGKTVYCVDDPSVQTVGGLSAPMSAKNLRVTTVGDELKMATAGKGRVVGVSFKDRAAILLAGHAADTVVWFDSGNGKWVTSSFYAPDKKLRPWVEGVNARNVAASAVGNTWTPLLPDGDYELTRLAPFVKGAPTAPVFAHKLANISDFTSSSFGQEYLFETVKSAIVGEELGADDYPDLLCVNLATNDYVGHKYGPNSPEAMDISVRTDRLLSDLFSFLDRTVKGGLASTVIVVTADHGVAPIPEEAHDTYRIGGAVRGSLTALTKAVDDAMAAKYGAGKYVLYCEPPHLYLDRQLLSSKGVALADAEDRAAQAARSVSGVYEAFAGEDILAGRLPDWPWTKMVANGYDRALSGDVMVFEVPGTMFIGGNGTTHGTPWAYDTHVPLLIAGPGIRPGTYAERVSQCDIAPSLCRLLRIEQPSGCVGSLLARALGS